MALCSGLQNEARLLAEILEKLGFEIVSVICEAGALSHEQAGIGKDQTFVGSANNNRLAPCSGIVQAKLLNAEKTNFNVLVVLCVDQNYLFFKYSHAPDTVLIAKNRVMGHNPAAALYQSKAHYRRIQRPTDPEKELGLGQIENHTEAGVWTSVAYHTRFRLGVAKSPRDRSITDNGRLVLNVSKASAKCPRTSRYYVAKRIAFRFHVHPMQGCAGINMHSASSLASHHSSTFREIR